MKVYRQSGTVTKYAVLWRKRHRPSLTVLLMTILMVALAPSSHAVVLCTVGSELACKPIPAPKELCLVSTASWRSVSDETVCPEEAPCIDQRRLVNLIKFFPKVSDKFYGCMPRFDYSVGVEINNVNVPYFVRWGREVRKGEAEHSWDCRESSVVLERDFNPWRLYTAFKHFNGSISNSEPEFSRYNIENALYVGKQVRSFKSSESILRDFCRFKGSVGGVCSCVRGQSSIVCCDGNKANSNDCEYCLKFSPIRRNIGRFSRPSLLAEFIAALFFCFGVPFSVGWSGWIFKTSPTTSVTIITICVFYSAWYLMVFLR